MINGKSINIITTITAAKTNTGFFKVNIDRIGFWHKQQMATCTT